MGYNTDYTLSADTDVLDTYIFQKLFTEKTNGYSTDDLTSVKWYDWEQDMKNISTYFPDVIFTLKGRGEDQDSPWVHYFNNGKGYEAKIVMMIEPFDKAKLRS